MAELADALDLGSSALKACRFKSCSRHHRYSSSKYSSGTSSAGTSRVCTSRSSEFVACSTPATTSASNAFPSSSNSSTLSESAPSAFERPCKSPDWRPERVSSWSGKNASVSTLRVLWRICFFGAFTFFAAIFFLLPAFAFAVFFFGDAFFFFAAFFLSVFLRVVFLLAVLFDLVGLFLDFFLAAIGAVYHW